MSANYYYPYFTGEKTEAQRGEVTWSHSLQGHIAGKRQSHNSEPFPTLKLLHLIARLP